MITYQSRWYRLGVCVCGGGGGGGEEGPDPEGD